MVAPSDEQKKLVAKQVAWAAQRLREMRESAGFTQSQVGDAMGMTGKRVSDIERARDNDIYWGTICRYCLAIGASVDDWLKGCPGVYRKDRMPSAVVSGMEFQFLMKLLDRTELKVEQLKDIEKWAAAKSKAA